MKIHKFLTVQNGKIEVDGLEKFEEGEKVSVTIQRIYPKRSNQQNRYIHGILFKVPAEEFGNSIEDVKMHLKALFLSDNKEPISQIKGTSELSSKEMTEFIERARDYFSREWMCYIPAPHEVQWLDDFTWVMR